jgi:undecaprenyl-diphosphatase
MLGNKKERLAQFSFLMVIPPILGEALLDMKDLIESGTGTAGADTSVGVLAIGFIAAFLAGCAACKWMISIVRKGKLIWFGIYCAVAGILTLIFL